MTDYSALARQIEDSGVAFPPRGSGVSNEAILAAEGALSIQFPESYRWWLREYGGGQIGGDIVYGVDEPGIGIPDVVKLNRGLGTPRGQVVVCIGNEETFFLQADRIRPDGECDVLLKDAGHITIYASSFAEFLRRRISEIFGHT